MPSREPFFSTLLGSIARPDHPAVAGPDRRVARGHGSDGPIEAPNNLIKRIKRIWSGFIYFCNYRIRTLLFTPASPRGMHSQTSPPETQRAG